MARRRVERIGKDSNNSGEDWKCFKEKWRGFGMAQRIVERIGKDSNNSGEDLKCLNEKWRGLGTLKNSGEDRELIKE